ncbi:antibiotic biosynthesis monooxygenase [Flavobacteriaceae bacterium LSUCC0859]|nr:antibiotic biosynthesis monooxygenase [Flavobacteriaceae bacterium LSUCC0859]
MYTDQQTPPYFAVIFTSLQTENKKGYLEMAVKMEDLARKQPGFLGVDSARDGLGITVSYWESMEAILNWKQQADHLFAQKKGQEQWYQQYSVRVCEVLRSYDFNKGTQHI